MAWTERRPWQYSNLQSLVRHSPEGVQESNALSIWPQGQAPTWREQKDDPGRIRTCMNWFTAPVKTHSAQHSIFRLNVSTRIQCLIHSATGSSASIVRKNNETLADLGSACMGKENEGREIRTPNLLIWSQTRCRCAIPPLVQVAGLFIKG